MKKVLLDTSFILSAVEQKIDFFEVLYLEGYKILIPEKVINELKSLKELSRRTKERDSATLALRLIENNSNLKIVKTSGKTTDSSIVNYGKENSDVLIATLDREIKRKTRNKKVVIRGKKKIEVI